MSFFLGKTRELEHEIDQYLDMIVHGALHFQQGTGYFLQDRSRDFEKSRQRLSDMEAQADVLRRTIEPKLHIHTLIPQSRGDVLGLMESSDKVLNQLEQTLSQFSVENPEIVQEVRGLFLELVEATVLAVSINGTSHCTSKTSRRKPRTSAIDAEGMSRRPNADGQVAAIAAPEPG